MSTALELKPLNLSKPKAAQRIMSAGTYYSRAKLIRIDLGITAPHIGATQVMLTATVVFFIHFYTSGAHAQLTVPNFLTAQIGLYNV